MKDYKIPLGKGQILPISECRTEQLVSFLAWNKKQPPNPQYERANAERNAAIEAEIARRKSGQSSEPAGPKLATIPERKVAVAIHDAREVSNYLQELAADCHVLSPLSHVDCLPPGCGIATSFVLVNPEECYDVGSSKVGLPAHALQRIGIGLNVQWDPQWTMRLDDRSEPLYCYYRAFAHVRSFDGSQIPLHGVVEIDMREKSPQVAVIRERAAERAKRDGTPNDDGHGQIQQIRNFILRHADTKAKLRAISGFGVRRAYYPQELSKPFATARLIFTGHSDDPVLKEVFAREFSKMMMGTQRVAYGAPLPPELARKERVPPPPVGETHETSGLELDYDFEPFERTEGAA